ncbi:DUF4157 domain-containing protein [Cohnella sp. GCM10027633]|uniref:eCIS core domain-containing protein n=1 Tax=unclassified Cohnella TaxID=2636738 RepID=UPI00362AD9A4
MKPESQERENHTGMPDQLKAGVEALSGIDVSDVKVNYNSDKPAQLNALAYAKGNDIHLGPGQEKHLPHEAWHVVQQRQGRVNATVQAKGLAVNEDESLETEADEMGEQAMQLKTESPVKLSAGNTSNTGVAQLQDDYYPSGDKEPHIHMHAGGITYTDVGHSHKTLQSGDQVRENAIMEVYQTLQELDTDRARDIIQWIQNKFDIDPPEPDVEEESDEDRELREWTEGEMEDHNPDRLPPEGFSYGSYTSKLK